MPKFGSQINTLGIPIKGLSSERGTAFPGSPFEGMMFHRTDLKQSFIYLNAAWVRNDAAGLASASHTHTKSQISDLAEATESVAGLVELATVAEATAGTDTSRATTPAGVKAAINALIGAAPAALDTLNELAAALGNDPNFATTITNALAQKADLSHTHALTASSITGILPISKGGTGAGNVSGAKSNLQFSGFNTGTVPELTAGTWTSISHSLGTAFVTAAFYEKTSGDEVILDVRYGGSNISVRSDVLYNPNTLDYVILG